MAGRSGSSNAEQAGAVGRADEAGGRADPGDGLSRGLRREPGGQAKSSQKIEDLMEMVNKLQKAGSLEPRIDVLINRINEVQQETLRILRLHCQEKESETQRKHTMLQECKERISALNSQIEQEKNKQRQLRLDFEEQLEDLMGQHKDLWEFHKPEQLALEIGALDSSKGQLLKEEKLVEAKLEDVKHRLCSQFGAKGCSAITEGLFLRSEEAAAVVHLFEEENEKAQEFLEAAAQRQEQLQQKCQQLQQKRQRLKEELEKLGVQVPAQGQSKQEEGAGPGEAANPKPLGVSEEKDPEPPTKQSLMPS
ncbi:hypothetical protein J1605_015126 [Eschrichtius robustus]|uniref:Synaptonemal complex central element protein 1 n=1 Tax=Eschrichtius robustus TaxID=9764 RepID=A0AB34GAS9_ESCRO|nr:hypothetical protein J1605_015126 [Eschrichtius robustus]